MWLAYMQGSLDQNTSKSKSIVQNLCKVLHKFRCDEIGLCFILLF